MIDGSMWIRCTRCRKSWFPPVKIKFYFDAKGRNVAPKDGVFDNAKFLAAREEYNQALKMTTSGYPSSSVICSFHKWNEETRTWEDGKEAYQEMMANSNLR